MIDKLPLLFGTIAAIYCGYKADAWNSNSHVFDMDLGAGVIVGVIVFFVVGMSVQGSIDLVTDMWSDVKQTKQRHQFLSMVVSALSLCISVAAFLRASGK